MASPASKEMHLYSSRLASFNNPHQLKKRRKSSSTTRKKQESAVEWPHKSPSAEQLARAGFFYRPSEDSSDNVQCFFCDVKLDGWEPLDDPIREHLVHSSWCAWATARSVDREDERADVSPEERDPMSETLLAARLATFTHGDGWPHEGKKGWKCKITKMVQAGWAWDPTADGDEADGVTCFYCNLSLDGWEPEDDPLLEHQRRAPDCAFFKLLEQHQPSAEQNTKSKRSKGKKKGGTASNRTSIQSIASEIHNTIESLPEVVADSSLAVVDDSIVTTATVASNTTTTETERGKKKGSRSKGTSKSATTKKKLVSKVEVEEAQMIDYPDLGEQPQSQDGDPMEVQEVTQDEAPKKPTTKSKRKPARPQRGSSVTENDPTPAIPAKKPARNRKAKTKDSSIMEDDGPDPDKLAYNVSSDNPWPSNTSEQLQGELDHSIDNFEEVPPANQSTPPVTRTNKCGTKRTSDGLPKPTSPPTIVNVDDSITVLEKPAGKAKRGRKAKQPAAPGTDSQVDDPNIAIQAAADGSAVGNQQADHDTDLGEESTADTKSRPKQPKTRTKTKKKSSASSTRLSKTSSATLPSPKIFSDEPEDLAKDELEIEAELARIEAEQAAKDITDENRVPSPKAVPSEKQVSHEQKQAGPGIAFQIPVSPVRLQQISVDANTPSPGGSDKENQPSSIARPSTKKTQSRIILSPTKTTKIPLAPTTPNRSPARAQVSPSKQISHLSSTAPWTAIDLDTVLLQSPQPTPGRLGQALLAVAGDLTSPEKDMSVEEWVKYQAMKGEEDMKQRCEKNVAAFEREGIRGIQSLAGIEAVG